MHTAVRALLAAVLENGEGAEKAFKDFSHELFPEQTERERAFDERSAKVLEIMGEEPIVVEPAVDIGSAWGRRVRAAGKPPTREDVPEPKPGPSWNIGRKGLREGLPRVRTKPATKDGK